MEQTKTHIIIRAGSILNYIDLKLITIRPTQLIISCPIVPNRY